MPQRPPTDECSRRLGVLAEATRLAIIRALMEGPLRVGVIGERLCVEQSLLSHHLRALRESGLVVAMRQGKGVVYRLADGVRPSKSREAIHLGCCRLTFEPKEPTS